MTLLITRKEALRKNLKFFFTGRACKYGHLSKRITTNNNCYECSLKRQNDPKKAEEKRIKRRKRYLENKERELALAKEYRKTHKDTRYRDNPKRRAYAKKKYEEIKDDYNKKRRLERIENPNKFRIKQKEFYNKNKEKLITRQKEYYLLNSEQRKIYNKKYRLENIEKIKKQRKIYQEKFPDKIKEQRKKSFIKNRDKILEIYQKNKDQIAKRRKELFEKNPEKYRSTRRIYAKKKRKTLNVRLSENLRKRIVYALKASNRKKDERLQKLIGCNLIQLKKHLEKQFKPGMNWANYGYYGWHVDHIKPVSKYNLEDIDQQMECFNYKNLQPLWAKENFEKSDKI